MSTKNEVFEYLIDQLRQQVGSNPYKQQCEDLAREVQSLKNQLRDASAQIKALATATGDVDAYKLIRKGDTPGCKHNWLRSKHRTGFFCSDCGARKEDTQECSHNWRFVNGKAPAVCINCGATKAEGCEHDWYFYDKGASMMCKKCGLKK